MKRNLFLVLLMFGSLWAIGQAAALPSELLSEHVCIYNGKSMKYAIGMLVSGPVEYTNPLSDRWQIVNVNNTENKNYYAFKYKGGNSYLTYGEGWGGFNSRTYKEGVNLSPESVFEIYKQGDFYLIYCIGTKTYLRMKEYKRGGVVDGVKDAKSATLWSLVSVPKDPDAFFKSYKADANSIGSKYFMICNQSEDKCVKLNSEEKKIEWSEIKGHTSTELWQIIPVKGFKDLYFIRNKATNSYLRPDGKGGFTYSTSVQYQYAKPWFIKVSDEHIILTPMPAVFMDNPKTTTCGDSVKLTLVQKDS